MLKKITKEQYNRAINEHNGYIAEEDMGDIFSQSEICGYGCYGARATIIDGEYYVTYWLGSTCD